MLLNSLLRPSAACAVLVLGACALAAPAAPPITLRVGQVELDADRQSGALLRVAFASRDVTLTAPAGAAGNYRLLVVGPDKSVATILGREQRLTGSTVNRGTLTLRWDGPLKDTAGSEHKIAVRMTARAAGAGLTFALHLENGTPGKVQEVSYPYLGGITGFGAADGKPSDATIWFPTSTPTERPMLPTAGGAGLAYPGQLNMGFACLQSKATGQTLYMGMHDPVARSKGFRLTEAGGGDLAASVQHTPFVPPGGSFDGSPVMFQVVKGDWLAASRLYREFFQGAFGIVQPSEDWIRRQSFFVMTMFMMPEGTIGYTFKDIPRWALAAKKAGLGAVQVSGWQMGGHDNGYPLYEPDPRLGTWEELAAGIRYCHKLGLKVYFFANYQPMMVEMERYKTEWSKYREMAPGGGYTWMAGWGMGTVWARAGHPKLMTWANLAFPQFRRVIVDYFARLASIGADGVHVDKMFPSGIDYNPDSPLSPDSATWEGAITLSKEIMAACRKLNPDWCMSFECNWDRMLQFGGATWWVGNQLITRKVFPEHVETTSITQAYDILGVNNLVRDGHVVMLAPMSFGRGLDWAPVRGLADYVRQVKLIRDQLADAVFYGRSLGQEPVKLEGGPPDGVAYNVWVDRRTGRRVCILTNSRMEPRALTFPGFAGAASGRVRLHVPGHKVRTLEVPAVLTVPAERVVFVEEVGGKP